MYDKKMCMAMLVKNDEKHVLSTLTSIHKMIDCFVISNIGSTDNTINIIQQFMDEKGIYGLIYNDNWINFGHNRTKLLNYCRTLAKYTWMINPGDVVNIEKEDEEKEDFDCYEIWYGKEFRYRRKQIFKNDTELNWRYKGIIHEYPTCRKKNYTNYQIDNLWIEPVNKNFRKAKYLKDAMLLKNYTDSRNVFYCAQSYFDAGEYEKAIEKYSERVQIGGWREEVHYSLYRIALTLEKLNRNKDEVIDAYLRAYEYLPEKVEPLVNISIIYRKFLDYENAYKYAKLGSKIKYPDHMVLFILKNCYDYCIWEELAISSYYVGNYRESYEIHKRLLDICPKTHKSRLIENIEFAKNKLEDYEIEQIDKMISAEEINKIEKIDQNVVYI